MVADVLAINMLENDVLDCVCAALSATAREFPGFEGCPCRRYVAPGSEVSWEGCDTVCGTTAQDDAGGQLTVSLVRVYESSLARFPAQAVQIHSLKHCQVPPLTAVELEVTVLRCAPVGETPGGPVLPCGPSTTAWSDAARQQSTDILSVRRGLECCLAGTQVTPFTRDGRRFVIGDTRTVGPQGGCVGSVTRVTVLLEECIPCEQVTPAPAVAP